MTIALPFRKPATQNRLTYRTHVSSTPLFVVGGARSGTSILAILLRKYLKISFGTESQFFIRFFRRLGDYGDLNHSDNLRRLVDDISRERCFRRWKKWNYVLDVDKIYSKIGEKSYSGILEAIFNDLADHNQMTRWGDKTPEYIYHLDILNRLFPNAQYIHIVRDGRDVAMSTFLTHFGAENIVVAALEWRRQLECLAAFRKTAGDGKILEIKYEDMLVNPVAIFLEIMAFLNIPDSDGVLRCGIESHLEGELMQDNFNKWKTALCRKDQERFEAVAHAQLQRYGYPVVTDGRKSISALSSFGYIVDNKIRKIRRFDYWQDNFYKLKIHANALKRALTR